jgi:hypothetical protein
MSFMPRGVLDMSVLHSLKRGAEPRYLLTLLAFAMVWVSCFGLSAALAQDEPILDSEPGLWTEIKERYEIVVLSRGLLLEPLGEGVELLTIEVMDNGVAIDGEPVTEIDLAQRIGDEDARLLFESSEETVLAEIVEEAEAEAEVAEIAGRKERDKVRRKYRDSQIAVGNSLTVHEDEVANEAVVFGGPLFVRGKVAGDAVAIGGSVTVSGEVTGDVAAVGGSLSLEPGAEVLGDVVSVGGEVEIDDEARVRGQIIEVPFGPNLRFGAWPRALFGGGHGWGGDGEHFDLSPWSMATGFMWEAFKLVVLALFACLVMLIAREPLSRVKRRAEAEPWKSGLVGLLVQILFGPLLVLVTLILIISIIGIPLVLLVPFFVLALILVSFLGYTAVAMWLGEFLHGRFGWKIESPYLILVLGVLTIQIWSVIGDMLDFSWGPLWFFAVMFGVLGIVVKYLAWTVGLGAAVLARFGTADGWGGRGQASSYLPPAAPVPSADGVEASQTTPTSSSSLEELKFDQKEPPITGPGPTDDGSSSDPSGQI